MLWMLLLCVAQAAVPDLTLSFQTPSSNSFSVPLNAYIVGNNLTYSVSGEYYSPAGERIFLSQPTVSQGMEAIQSCSKPQNPANSFLIDPLFANISYSLEGAVLVSWSLSQFPAITEIAHMEFQENLAAMYAFVADSEETAIVLLNYSQTNLTFYVVVSQDGQLELLENMTFTTQLWQSFTGASFENRDNLYIYAQGFDGNSGYIAIYALPTTFLKPIHFIANITSETVGSTLSPVKFVGQGDIGVLCDLNGVFIMNVVNVTSRPPSLLSALNTSADYSVSDCLMINDVLILSTSQGVFNYTIVYTLDTYGFPAVLLQANDPICQYVEDSVAGSIFLQNSPQGMVLAYYEITPGPAAKRFNFKVLNNAALDLGQTVVVDIPTGNFLVDWEFDPFPAFLLNIVDGILYVIFDTYSELQVYRIHRSPTLTFLPNATVPYTYRGVIVTNADSNNTFFLNVTALDITQTAKAYCRVDCAPVKVQHYLGGSDSVYTDMYFPVSNYVFGPNLTFTISAYPNPFTNRSVEIPPVRNLTQSTSYPQTAASPRIQALDSPLAALMAVLTWNNSVDIYQDQVIRLNQSLISSLHPSILENTLLSFSFALDLVEAAVGLILLSSDSEGNMVLDLFDLASASEPLWAAKTAFHAPEVKSFAAYDGFAYALVPGEVLVFKFSLSSAAYSIDPSNPISAASLPHISQFNPLNFASSTGSQTLYILEASLGLVYIEMNSLSESYVLMRANYAIENVGKASLVAGAEQVYVVGDSGNQLIQLSPNITTALVVSGYYLSDPACAYRQPTSAGVYIALLCSNSTSSQVYIFDTTTTMPDSLVTAIPLRSNSSIAISQVSGYQYHLYTYDGQSVTRYSIGQSAASWSPSGVTQFPGTTIWARVTLYFAAPPNATEYTVMMQVNATCYQCAPVSINVTYSVVNPGTFILTSPTNTSIFVDGQPQEYTVFTTAEIPQNYFVGLDITFNLIINGNQMNPIKPSTQCAGTNFVCLLQKYVKADVEPIDSGEYLAFTLDESDVLFLSYPRDMLYSIGRDLALLATQPFNVTALLHLRASSCYLLATFQNCNCPNMIAAACFGLSRSAVASSFVLVLNTSDSTVVTQQVDFVVESLSAISMQQEGNDFLLFVSDGTQVYVYAFISGQKPYLYSKISPASLGLSWLSPNSLNYVNSSTYILGDSNHGTLLLTSVDYTHEEAQFALSDYLTPSYGDDSVVAVRVVISESTDVAILTEAGYFTLYDLSNRQETMVVNPVEVPEVVPFTDVLALTPDMDYAAYFVIVGGTYNVRILSLANEWRAAAYATIDTGISPSANMKGSIALQNYAGNSIQVAFLLPGLLNYTTYTINLQNFVVVTKTPSSSANFTMQLMATNAISKAVAPVFVVYFNASYSGGEEEITRFKHHEQVYENWWFWASIGFGLIVSFTAVALLFIKYYGRRKLKRRVSIAMAQSSATFDRFSNLSVS